MDVEQVMAKRWSDLSGRRLIVASTIAEAILKLAELIDTRRRPGTDPL